LQQLRDSRHNHADCALTVPPSLSIIRKWS